MQDNIWLAQAQTGDEAAFGRLVGPFRRELQFHCYRMTGGFDEAQDLVQETMLRAWRGLVGFEGRSTFRHWLYSIATNVCLTALEQRRRPRSLPELLEPATNDMPGRAAFNDVAWLEPYPDVELDHTVDPGLGPEDRHQQRQSVKLAFVAAIQLLPARQRAVLLLCEVVGWSAAETASVLGMSVAAINSALQRSRATLKLTVERGSAPAQSHLEKADLALLQRYVQAWESKDLDSFASLLSADALYSMPPRPEWYRGRQNIRAFFTWAWREGGYTAFRLVSTGANLQPAFAVYARGRSTPETWSAHSLQVVSVSRGKLTHLTAFLGASRFAGFGLPQVYTRTS